MRIILLTVQFKPKNLCIAWPKHALPTRRRCPSSVQHPLPARGPPTFMAYAERWVPSVNSLDRLRRPLRPLHRLDPAHSHSSHSLALATHALQPGNCCQANVCGNVRGESRLQISCQLSSCHWAGCPSRRPCAAHARLRRYSRPPQAILRAECLCRCWDASNIRFPVFASEMHKADSRDGSIPSAGTNESARHLLGGTAGSKCAEDGVARPRPTLSCDAGPDMASAISITYHQLGPQSLSTGVSVMPQATLFYTVCKGTAAHVRQHYTHAHEQAFCQRSVMPSLPALMHGNTC